MTFNINSLLLNTNSVITIIGRNNLNVTRVRVQGIVQGEFSVGGSNDFDTPFDTTNKDLGGGAVGKVFNFAKAFASAKGISTTIKEFTRNVWKGSARPQFTVPMTFIATKDDSIEDVTKKVAALMRGVYPEEAKLGILSAPMGYDATTGRGTFTISIGKWFRARKMVMKSVDFQFSAQHLRSGRPLYAVGSITFEPYQNISIDEFESYIRNAS
jgi:hypothetical protein